jgi:hypothetical protein
VKTLDEFIRARLAKEVWPTNAYVKEKGFRSLYVRLNRRHIQGEMWNPVLDIANGEAKKPGSGAFTSLVQRLQEQHPEMGLFVECVLNERFRQKLLTLGFQSTARPEDLSPSYWLPPKQKPDLNLLNT